MVPVETQQTPHPVTGEAPAGVSSRAGRTAETDEHPGPGGGACDAGYRPGTGLGQCTVATPGPYVADSPRRLCLGQALG